LQACLISLTSWLQCGVAVCESTYSCKKFQGTIAWYPRYHFSLSVSWLFSCPSLGDWLLPCPTRSVFIPRSEICQWEITRLLGLTLFEWKPWSFGLYFWAMDPSASACPDIPLYCWLEVAIQRRFALQDEFPSNCDQFATVGKAYFCLGLFQWQIPWYLNLCHAISLSNWTLFQPTGVHWKVHFALLFSWEVTNTFDSVLAITYIPATALLLISCLSEALVLYLHVTTILHWGSELMTW
jgi:hypothetical protein